MSSTLFDEAIADAKNLRDVAEQNAKNAIVEAITPKIKEFIEDQLIEGSGVSRDALDEDEHVLNDIVNSMFSSVTETNTDEDIVLDEDAISALVDLVRESDSKTKQKDSSTQKSKKSTSVIKKLSEALDILSSDEINKGIEGRSSMSRRPDQEVYYDIDLDSLISESAQEENAKSPEAKEEVDDDDLKEILRALAEEELNEAEIKLDLGELDLDEEAETALRDALSRASLSWVEEEEGEDLDVDLDAPEGDDEDLGDLDAPDDDLGDMLPLPAEEDDPDMEEVMYEVDEKMLRQELSRLRQGIREANSPTKSTRDYREINLDAKRVKEVQGRLQNESRKNRALGQKLAKYRGAVDSLRGQLSEMNLFNAKLLYVNKLLQDKKVSSSQRRSIIESLDRAKSLREVKLLYRSLRESIDNRSSETITESAVRHSVGSSSRPTTSSSPGSKAASEVDRWAKLAGIK